MKKKITAILFIGVIALISMGFQTTYEGNDNTGHSSITIVKGQIIKSDRHHDWDLVTFGLDGYKPHRDAIVYVDILDQDGQSVGEVDYDMIRHAGRTYWFAVDLRDFDNIKEFTLVVRVSSKKGISDGGSVTVSSYLRAEAPIDPDETILILKYP